MKKSDINILIVEDDATQGPSLFEAFKRAGYHTVLAATSVQALTHSQRQEFHALIVDCLLPKMNGVDLVEEILALLPHRPKVLMTSGIFKDKAFIKETVDRTKADGFFVKPLNLSEILRTMEDLLKDVKSPEKPAILDIYSNRALNDHEMIQVIVSEPTIQAFHLPKLYSRMQDTTLTGELTLISSIGEISSVCFFEGRVFSVRTPDKESFFGGLAVAFGLVSPEEVMQALQDPTQKPLGQKLIDAMYLSPHSIQTILEEQTALRLSQTIHEGVISLQWIPRNFPKPDYHLADARFEQLAHDWMESKLNPEWLRSGLMQWGPFVIEGQLGESLSQIKTPLSFEELLAHPGFSPERDLQPLFWSLFRGEVHVGLKREKPKDFQFLAARVDRFLNAAKSVNYFQMLELGETAHAREINRSYEGLRESFDVQKLPGDCPPELIKKCAKVIQILDRVHGLLSDDIQRMRYIQQLQNKRSQEMLETEPVFRAAILELQAGQAKSAYAKFSDLLQRKMEFKDIRAFALWAGLRSRREFNDIRLDQIAPEERHSQAYAMAKGVQYANKGQFKKALECYRTAHMLDPRTTIAKYELFNLKKMVERQAQPSKSLQAEIQAAIERMSGRRSRHSA